MLLQHCRMYRRKVVSSVWVCGRICVTSSQSNIILDRIPDPRSGQLVRYHSLLTLSYAPQPNLGILTLAYAPPTAFRRCHVETVILQQKGRSLVSYFGKNDLHLPGRVRTWDEGCDIWHMRSCVRQYTTTTLKTSRLYYATQHRKNGKSKVGPRFE